MSDGTQALKKATRIGDGRLPVFAGACVAAACMWCARARVCVC